MSELKGRKVLVHENGTVHEGDIGLVDSRGCYVTMVDGDAPERFCFVEQDEALDAALDALTELEHRAAKLESDAKTLEVLVGSYDKLVEDMLACGQLARSDKKVYTSRLGGLRGHMTRIERGTYS